jgi:hypothetical protein
MYRTRAKLRCSAHVPLPERVIKHAYEHAWVPATYRYPRMAREFLRSVQMREIYMQDGGAETRIFPELYPSYEELPSGDIRRQELRPPRARSPLAPDLKSLRL